MDKKPKGYFKYIMAFDFETSGLAMGGKNNNPVRNDNEEYQIVSAGLVIADSETLLPIDELYLEVKWNGVAKWSKRAENIHGLSLEYLEENGMTEEEAVLEIGNFIFKYFGDRQLQLLGHNIASFDILFLRDLFNRHGISLKISHRCVDTNALGFVAFNSYTSDELFDLLGMDERGAHNALDDAKMSLEAARMIRLVFQKAIG